jgi:hypothetical protein
MLQELAAGSDASSAWATASMLFFIAVFAVVTVRTFRARPEELDANARLVLDGDEPAVTRTSGEQA